QQGQEYRHSPPAGRLEERLSLECIGPNPREFWCVSPGSHLEAYHGGDRGRLVPQRLGPLDGLPAFLRGEELLHDIDTIGAFHGGTPVPRATRSEVVVACLGIGPFQRREDIDHRSGPRGTRRPVATRPVPEASPTRTRSAGRGSE